MKKVLSILVLVLAFNFSSAQESPTLENVTISDTYIEYKTDKNGAVGVSVQYSSTSEGNDMSNEDLRKVLNWANSVTISMLKSRRSYVPFTFVVKYKYSKKGKHKYAVHVSYAGSNSYGGEVEAFQMYELNKKFRETFGSVMLRS